MKRYLVGYTKNVLTIRDRKTNQSKRLTNVSKEIADIYKEAISKVNYNLREVKASKIKLYSIDDLKDWINAVDNKQHNSIFNNEHKIIKLDQLQDENLSKQLDSILEL